MLLFDFLKLIMEAGSNIIYYVHLNVVCTELVSSGCIVNTAGTQSNHSNVPSMIP